MSSPTKSTSDTNSTTAGEAWDILCVLGEDGAREFSISATNGTTIAQFKKAIYQERVDKLSGLVPAALNLHLVSVEGTVDDIEIKGSQNVPEGSIEMTKVARKLQRYIGNRDCNTFYVFVEFSPPVAQVAVKALRTTVEALQKTIETLKADYIFSLIIAPKRSQKISWSANPQTATLDALKEVVRNEYYPEITNSAVLKLTVKQSKGDVLLGSDQDLQIILRQCVQQNMLIINISVQTPSKAFSSYTLRDISVLYELSDVQDPELKQVFPVRFDCERSPIRNPDLILRLIENLIMFSNSTPLEPGTAEATNSQYVHLFLTTVVSDFIRQSNIPTSDNPTNTPTSENPTNTPTSDNPTNIPTSDNPTNTPTSDNPTNIPTSYSSTSPFSYLSYGQSSDFVVRLEKAIHADNGNGPVDFAILLSDGIVGVTEVKKSEDGLGFYKGLAQNAVQIESALPHPKKRKRNAVDIEGTDINEVPTRCFGIVTDAVKWYFLECTRDINDKVKFRLSDLYTVAYGKPSMREDIREIAETINWLLQEAQSPNAAASKKRKRAKTDVTVQARDTTQISA